MHLALYRKYRSATFDEVISQEHITTTLKNQIKSGTPAHAYLFTGSRGTGKTTCAKLMAKAVNCLSPVDGNPCGECESCKAIAAGCPDIIEMDAASNNGVDDVRALRDEVMYAPTVCKYKVYIIDEVHMLSASAFNALLKTIEEPPPHVIFILATTEIHKVPATIASRCQQFRFSRIDVEQSTKRLCEIAQKENVKLTEDAARLISRLSDGGMRDAVSLLDQCISVSNDIDEETVRTTAGIAGTDHLFALAECVREHNAPEALKIIDELHNQSKDLMLLLDELLSHFRNLCMLTATNNDFSLIPAGSGTRNDLARQAGEFTLGEIMRCMDILQDCIARTPKTAKRKTVAEMCLIRLCTPRLDSDTSALSLRLEKLENRLDKLCDGGIKIQPRSAAPTTTEYTEPAKPASKPVAPTESKPQDIKPQDILIDTLNKIENKANTADIPPVPEAPQVPDSKPDWLFEGDANDVPPTDSGAAQAEEPPFELDEPTAQPQSAPQADGEKPDWLFEGTGGDVTPENSNYNADNPPFDLDEPAEQSQPVQQDNSGKPDWLFEGKGNDDAMTAAEPTEPTAPPFDFDEPPLPPSVSPVPPEPDTAPPVTREAPGQHKVQTQMSTDTDPQVAEITDRLPVILQAILGQVRVTLRENEIVIGGYQKFQYDFLTTGDSKERLEKTAEEVLGRKMKMVFDGDDGADTQTAENDPVSDFLTKAEKMGVKIKYKKSKN